MNLDRQTLEFREGFKAYAEGKTRRDNPYKCTYERTRDATAEDLETLSDNFAEWSQGFDFAEDSDDTQ